MDKSVSAYLDRSVLLLLLLLSWTWHILQLLTLKDHLEIHTEQEPTEKPVEEVHTGKEEASCYAAGKLTLILKDT